MLCIYKSSLPCLHTLFTCHFWPGSRYWGEATSIFFVQKRMSFWPRYLINEFQVSEHVSCMGSYSCEHIGKESNNALQQSPFPALAPSLVCSAIYKGLRGMSWRLLSTGGTSHFPGFPSWCEHLTECRKRIKFWKWDLCWKNLCWKWIIRVGIVWQVVRLQHHQ